MNNGRPAKTERSAFGERVFQAREEKGLSQKQVSEALDIPQQTYANWERRSVAIKPDDLVRLAFVLETSVETLLGIDPKPKKQGGPAGKARQLFDELNQMSRHQQQHILRSLEDLIAGQKARKAS